MPQNHTSSPADFDAYLRQPEPQARERAEAWQMAIGLQAADGLRPSAYLYQTVRRHIEGEISIDDVRELVNGHYLSKEGWAQAHADAEQADKVSANIACLLAEQTFTFSPVGFLSLHRRIFEGVFPFAGKLREYNITQKEWVLGGESVYYSSAMELEATLEYDFLQEKRFNFSALTLNEVIEHIAKFLAELWQIHPFAEGNTRTTAVFAIKYLRSMGFEVSHDVFTAHSRFFRNALVRANYRNMRLRIEPTLEPLVHFLRNALLGEAHPLRNHDWRVGVVHDSRAEEPAPRKKTEKAPSSPAELHLRHKRLLRTLGASSLGVAELLRALRLSTRQSFMRVWLSPAMSMGLIKALHPESPRHPQQKYLLTTKGKRILKQLIRQ